MKNYLFAALCLFCFLKSYSQTIDASRRVDWSIAGVEGGIPCVTDETKIFNIMDYGGTNDGSADNYTAIQNAISAADASGLTPRVIYFPEGEYLVNTSVRVPDNTIIRGDGYDKTKFTFDLGGVAEPCFDTPIWDWGDYVDVTSGYSKGSTSIVVTDGSQFTVGEWIEIEEDNNATLMYTDPTWDQTWAEYSKGQFMRVTDISGNTITFDRPLKTDYTATQHIRARRGRLSEYIGFENFYITRPNTGDSYTFFLKNTSNAWIRGVYSWRTNKAHVWTSRCVNFEIRGCYFERSFDYGGGGHGYGISVGYHSHDGLIENNIFNRLRHHMIIAKGASGCVFGYNYSFDRVQGSDTNNLNQGWIPPDISIHGHWSYMNLFEGNVSQEIHSADYWGPSGPGTTFFRNHLEAVEGIMLDDGSVDQNVVGNELMLGTINEDASVSGTFSHGNNEGGSITWDGSSGSNNLIDSYYLTGKPAWWGSDNWPSIGPEFTIGSGSNPAKDRWDNGEPLALTYCEDCNGDVGGTAYTDNCSDCVGGNTGEVECTQDCNGDWGGSAYTDNCSDCVGGNTGEVECVQDCNGDWGGSAAVDNCSVCSGGNTGVAVDECLTNLNTVGGDNKIKVYPNPGSEIIHIQSTTSHDWRLYDSLGQLIMKGTSESFSIANLPIGVYVLKISGQSISIIKQ